MEKTKNKKRGLILLGIAIEFLLINFAVIVSADFCCEKTVVNDDGTGGSWCQDVTDEVNCDSEFISSPTSCEIATYCGGCCIDSDEGLCTTNSPKTKCEDDGGEWDEDESCLIDACQDGCCVLGGDPEFGTQARCELRSIEEGVAEEFEAGVSEADCRMATEIDEGACVLEGDYETTCIFTTEEECTGDFYEVYCSDDSLEEFGVDCDAEDHLGCDNNDIYWFDYCGNREDVNEDCSYPTKKCSEDNGEYVCKDLGCVEGDGTLRKNGESWCLYDSYVGDSRDVVGSEHWKVSCNKGEIDIVNCGGRRGKICAEMEQEGLSFAQCRVNLGLGCYSIDNIDECEETPDCRVQSVYITDHFHFDACVPKFPPGFDIDSADTLENGEDICSIGTQTCTTGEYKPFWGGWKCETNCKCKEYDFVKQMNDFCISLGDCGGYVNIKGDYTKNFQSSDRGYRGDLKEDDITEYKTYVEKENIKENLPQYISSLDSVNYLGVAMIELVIKEEDYGKDIIEKIVVGLGLSEERTRSLTFTCQPWKPPVEGDDCETCDDNLLKKCTEYKCKSLGASCVFLNGDTDNPVCIDLSGDVDYPIISFKEIEEGYGFTEGDNEVEITESIEEVAVFNFNLSTDEHAQCKWSLEKPSTVNYEDMANNYPFEDANYNKIHKFEMIIPLLDDPAVYNVAGDLMERTGNVNMYVRCQDYAGNFNVAEYIIKFNIKSGQDTYPPIIAEHKVPEDSSYLAHDTIDTLLNIWIEDGPADCKWDVESRSYDTMTNPMTCYTEISDKELYGWPCSTTLTGLINGKNKFYIRCKDKPWVTEENIAQYGERNPNKQSIPYTIYVSETALVIDSITPDETLEYGGADQISVELEVKTSGGVDSGKSKCSYKWQGYWVEFSETDSSSHNQPGLNLWEKEGGWEIPIKCEDDAENVDQKNAVFDIEVDSDYPVAVRVYHEGGDLKLITNEIAKCYYDFNSCVFNLEDATSMTGISPSTEHSAEWIVGQTYYIKCKDFWDKENPTCIIKVEPSNLN